MKMFEMERGETTTYANGGAYREVMPPKMLITSSKNEEGKDGFEVDLQGSMEDIMAMLAVGVESAATMLELRNEQIMALLEEEITTHNGPMIRVTRPDGTRVLKYPPLKKATEKLDDSSRWDSDRKEFVPSVRKDCFAYSDKGCKALTITFCKFEDCPFYKSRGQHLEEVRAIRKRLNIGSYDWED